MIEQHRKPSVFRRSVAALCLAFLAGCTGNATSTDASKTATVVLPSAPSDLTATPGNAQASLKWSASSGATSYDIKRSTNGSAAYTQIASATSPSYTDATVKNGDTYFYVVAAVNSAGESDDSNNVSVTPDPTISTPAVPMGLVATAGDTQASLAWSTSSGAISYNVKRATTSGGPYTEIAAPTSPAYTDNSLTNGTTYYYVVSAVNSAGESANSSQVSAVPAATMTIPTVPAGLSATPGNSQVALSWSSSSGATGYNVKRATTSGGPYTKIGAPTLTSYTDSSVTNGVTYFYVVSALDSAGESANSSSVSAIPAAPASLAAVPTDLSASPGNKLVSLNWSASSGATGYKVKRATTSGGPYTQVGAPTLAAYTDSSVTNGTMYFYVVSALDSTGESENSNQVSATPLATASCASARSGAKLNVWENITPSAFAGFQPLSVAVDPQNQALFSAAGNGPGPTGTGIYKSTDCGATWSFVSGGYNNDLTTGNVWSMSVVIDPNSPSGKSMYASGAYATASGGQALHKSTDGGVTWKVLNSDPNNVLSLHTDFVQVFAVDPTNPLHIAVTFHDNCTSMFPASCMSETFDGGTTWTEFNGPPISGWSEGAGIAILPGPNNTTSLIHTDEGSYNAYYAVDTPGATKTWIQVITNVPFYSSLFDLAADGTAYVGSRGGIYYSRATTNSPLGRTWTLLPNSPQAAALIDDGVNLIATDLWSQTAGQPFHSTPLATITNSNAPAWTSMTGSSGGASSTMAYDSVNRIVYSSNPLTGVWRYVEP
jgi:fibronectin type 3 domain-containing protein